MSETTKERLTVNLPPELIERARNAVYWTPGLTLAGLDRGGDLQGLGPVGEEERRSLQGAGRQAAHRKADPVKRGPFFLEESSEDRGGRRINEGVRRLSLAFDVSLNAHYVKQNNGGSPRLG